MAFHCERQNFLLQVVIHAVFATRFLHTVSFERLSNVIMRKKDFATIWREIKCAE